MSAVYCGQNAVRSAICRNAPNGALVLALGPKEADHRAIGREPSASNAHICGEKIAGVIGRICQFQLLASGAVLFAIGDIGQAGRSESNAVSGGRHCDSAHAFQLGDILGRHRASARNSGDGRGGEQCARSKRKTVHNNGSP